MALVIILIVSTVRMVVTVMVGVNLKTVGTVATVLAGVTEATVLN